MGVCRNGVNVSCRHHNSSELLIHVSHTSLQAAHIIRCLLVVASINDSLTAKSDEFAKQLLVTMAKQRFQRAAVSAMSAVVEIRPCILHY